MAQALDTNTLPLLLAQALAVLFFAILFLQSGLDKVFDWRGNLGWLTGHFAKSPLARGVPLLLASITVLEVGAGVMSAVGLVQLLLTGARALALVGVGLAGLALVSLFLGQRLAKDYAGAAALVPYFLVALFALFLLGA